MPTQPLKPTCPPPRPMCHVLYFHCLLASSLPVLCWFPSLPLFLFTPGWVKFSTFWLIALSPSSMGHCMKRLVILNFETKCGQPPFIVSHHYSFQSLLFVAWKTEYLVFPYLPFLTLVITLGDSTIPGDLSVNLASKSLDLLSESSENLSYSLPTLTQILVQLVDFHLQGF